MFSSKRKKNIVVFVHVFLWGLILMFEVITKSWKGVNKFRIKKIFSSTRMRINIEKQIMYIYLKI